MGAVRIILIILLIIMQAVFGAPEFILGTDHYLYRALSYSFFHANWWHLSVNGIAIWSIYSPKRLCKPCRDLVIPFIIAVLVYPFAFKPVIGFSNILYAVLGLRTPSLSSSWWKQTNVIIFIIVTIAMVFIPQFSAITHIISFFTGVFIASVSRTFNQLTKDARRYL